MANGHYLLPQLMPGEARQLVASLRQAPIPELAREAELRDLASVPAIYSPVGGNRMMLTVLKMTASRIRDAAARCGYPDSTKRARDFDIETAVLLHSELSVSPYEASRNGAWEFFTCILLPDVVRWRFPGREPGTDSERFLGGIRNTFQRLWRRAFVLHDPGAADPYGLLKYLLEDELVQITERPQLAADRALSRAVVAAFRKVLEQSGVNREELMRDAQKRLIRRMPVMAFDALDTAELNSSVLGIFNESAERLAGKSERPPPPPSGGRIGSGKGASPGGLRGLLGRLRSPTVGTGTR